MRLRFPLALGLSFAFGSTFPAGASAAQPNGVVKAQLDVQFAKAGLDKDGHLDAAELAKVFRGPNAKPIDHNAPNQAGKTPQPETHPDHLFMTAYDKNGDGRISKSEFEKYEQKVAADVKRLAEQQRRLQQQQAAQQRRLQQQLQQQQRRLQQQLQRQRR